MRAVREALALRPTALRLPPRAVVRAEETDSIDRFNSIRTSAPSAPRLWQCHGKHRATFRDSTAASRTTSPDRDRLRAIPKQAEGDYGRDGAEHSRRHHARFRRVPAADVAVLIPRFHRPICARSDVPPSPHQPPGENSPNDPSAGMSPDRYSPLRDRRPCWRCHRRSTQILQPILEMLSRSLARRRRVITPPDSLVPGRADEVSLRYELRLRTRRRALRHPQAVRRRASG